MHKKHEFRNFYRVKSKHETMLSRQLEASFKKD